MNLVAKNEDIGKPLKSKCHDGIYNHDNDVDNEEEYANGKVILIITTIMRISIMIFEANFDRILYIIIIGLFANMKK